MREFLNLKLPKPIILQSLEKNCQRNHPRHFTLHKKRNIEPLAFIIKYYHVSKTKYWVILSTLYSIFYNEHVSLDYLGVKKNNDKKSMHILMKHLGTFHSTVITNIMLYILYCLTL